MRQYFCAETNVASCFQLCLVVFLLCPVLGLLGVKHCCKGFGIANTGLCGDSELGEICSHGLGVMQPSLFYWCLATQNVG